MAKPRLSINRYIQIILDFGLWIFKAEMKQSFNETKVGSFRFGQNLAHLHDACFFCVSVSVSDVSLSTLCFSTLVIDTKFQSHFITSSGNQIIIKTSCAFFLPIKSGWIYKCDWRVMWETLYLNWLHELWVNISADTIAASIKKVWRKLTLALKICVWALSYSSELWHKLDQFKGF